MTARRATPRRKSLERHARAIIDSAYFERKLLSGPRSLSRGLARICPAVSRTGPISLSVGRAPNDQASPSRDSTTSLRRGLIPGRGLELDRVIINEGQNNKADPTRHRNARFKSHVAPTRSFRPGGSHGSESNCIPQIWNNGSHLGGAVVSWCNTRPPFLSHANGRKPLEHHGMA